MISFGTLKTLAFASISEFIGVGVAGASGLLIVNVMPKDQYAQYTFLIACTTLWTGLSDIGVNHCYLPMVGTRNGEGGWILVVARHLYSLRVRLLTVAAIVILPYWMYVSVTHAWWNSGYVVASVLAAMSVLVTLRAHVLTQILVILRRVRELSRANTLGNLIRLGAIGAIVYWIPPQFQLPVVLAASAIATFAIVAIYWRDATVNGFGRVQISEEARAELTQKTKAILVPLLLPAIFYQFQGIITVAMATTFGHSGTVAEVGALSRLSMILLVVDRVTAMLLFPNIARSPSGKPLRLQILRAHSLYLGCMALVVLSAVMFQSYWILLLGSKYVAQKSLVWLAVLSAVLMNGSGFAFTTLSSRGQASSQTLVIPVILVIQLVYVVTMGVGDTRHALGFAVVTALCYFFFQYALLARYLAITPVYDMKNQLHVL
ncbi:hypothetical protein [Paraburkholderia sp. GAS348]|uniref:hypothetical protein n=1 Tax=Paraburkholderia sp. GAS348 TaxID=3035132 RepID=UPI003D23E4B6